MANTYIIPPGVHAGTGEFEQGLHLGEARFVGERSLRELVNRSEIPHASRGLAIGSDPTRAGLAAVVEELDESQGRNHGIRIDIQQARDCYGAIFIGISREGEENPCPRPRPGSFAPGSRPAS